MTPSTHDPEIALIVACAENGVIGVDGDLPWSLPDDLAHFMRSTRGHPVVMGRRTLDSLPKPLTGRDVIVVSSTLSPDQAQARGARVVRTIEDAIEAGQHAARERGVTTVWIAGGETIYRGMLPLASRVVRTLVHTRVDGDTRFPDFPEPGWVLERHEAHGVDERHAVAFTVEWWIRSP